MFYVKHTKKVLILPMIGNIIIYANLFLRDLYMQLPRTRFFSVFFIVMFPLSIIEILYWRAETGEKDIKIRNLILPNKYFSICNISYVVIRKQGFSQEICTIYVNKKRTVSISRYAVNFNLLEEKLSNLDILIMYKHEYKAMKKEGKL